MSNNPGQSNARSARTRRAVLKAATKLFRTHGFDGTRTAEVARLAEVAEGTVFLHVRSKAGLLLAVVEDYYEALIGELEQLASDGESAELELRNLVRFWFTRIHRDWTLIRMIGPRIRFCDDRLSKRMLGSLFCTRRQT